MWVQTPCSFLSCSGRVGRGEGEICCPLEQTSSFYSFLKWLEAVPIGFHGERKRRQLCSEDLAVCYMLLPLFLASSVSGNGEGMLGNVSVQENVRLALPLVNGGVVCCSFLQRLVGKQPEEPSDLGVRISEYLGW